MKLTDSFGARLKYWREWRGFSQADLERETGINRITISHLENNQRTPSLHTIERLLDALNVNIAEFFEEE